MAAELSAILPLKTAGSHYAENLGRCDILMASLRAFAAPGLLRAIYVICPGDEVHRIERAARSWGPLPLEVVGEDDLLPFFRRYPRTPAKWRQMLIKLHASRLVPTDFFLTLDPDVFLCQPVGFDDLCPAGRALVDLEPRRQHPAWWQSSSSLLGAEPDPEGEGMSVTPAILSRDVCFALFDELARRHGGVDWREALLASLPSQWTEYTLYWVAACKLGLRDRYHIPSAEAGGRRLISAETVWLKEQWPSWRPERCFDPNEPGFFSVVQSNTRVPPDAVARRIAPHLAVDVRHRAGALGELASVFEDAWRILFGRRGTPSNRT